jgi:uncharacterized membrane protein YraQ (UPF0718 family)
MLMNLSHHKVATAFKRIIEVTGQPVHYFAAGVEIAAILVTYISECPPTHAFEYSHHALTCANVLLSVLLHRHHNHHKD